MHVWVEICELPTILLSWLGASTRQKEEEEAISVRKNIKGWRGDTNESREQPFSPHPQSLSVCPSILVSKSFSLPSILKLPFFHRSSPSLPLPPSPSLPPPSLPWQERSSARESQRLFDRMRLATP